MVWYKYNIEGWFSENLQEDEIVDKEKKFAIWIIIVCVSAIGCMICMGCLLTKSVELSVDCFAVDSAGQLYVGSNGEIRVYENQQFKYVISEYKGIGDVSVKGAIFTITSDDMITMATGEYVITMDLMGNVQEIQKDDTASVRGRLEGKKNRFVSQSGDVYTIRNQLGRTRIQKNGGELVYQISVFSLWVKVLLTVSVLGFAVTVPVIIIHALRERMAYR